MTQHWIQMDQTWLDDLESRLEERRQTIYRAVLQSPDYPPLPPCPQCGATPEAILSGSDHPEVFTANAVAVGFRPCGHTFRVDPEE
ncbi:hypothetical protein [Streptomyces phytophilus]|uniref:hypothetical protein n=1 Tax=Streptomyces phytophilus TaxID=722715 RepID=UPI0015EFECE6|nr:hypothetical protein [Streptomyces phytophilus]